MFISVFSRHCSAKLPNAGDLTSRQPIIHSTSSFTASGAGTNLKVGWGIGPAQKWGGTDPAQSAGEKFLVLLLHFFGSKSTISRFDERFRDGQYSLVSFLFAVLLLMVPPFACPAICKSGARAPVSYGVGATVLGAPVSAWTIGRFFAIQSAGGISPPALLLAPPAL